MMPVSCGKDYYIDCWLFHTIFCLRRYLRFDFQHTYRSGLKENYIYFASKGSRVNSWRASSVNKFCSRLLFNLAISISKVGGYRVDILRNFLIPTSKFNRSLFGSYSLWSGLIYGNNMSRLVKTTLWWYNNDLKWEKWGTTITVILWQSDIILCKFESICTAFGWTILPWTLSR